MERDRQNSVIAEGHYGYNTNGHCSRFCNDITLSDGAKTPCAGCIEHSVSRFDTLAGVAIKYGVEVADIKKMNGLVTDLQMFAFKTLLIPLPGRHPPSPCLSNASPASGQSSGNQTPTKHFPPDWLQSFHSSRLKGPAMNSLQGYYGLTEETTMSQVFEMAVYIMSAGEGKDGDPNDNLIRRRQKSEADFTPRLLKEENSSCGFSLSNSKRPTLRPRGGSRMNSSMMVEDEVRKSSCLHDHREKGISSAWPMASKWRVRQPQVQSLSAAGIAIPIFDGFTKPMSALKNKAALD